MNNKKRELKKIFSNIKSIKIQGATNIAKSALKAYYLSPQDSTISILKKLRPTEPMLMNVLKLAKKYPKKKILNHFNESQEKINSLVCKLIKNNSVVYTHCHSTNVINALIFTKKSGKKFEVYNTETRPLFQGRKTAKELSSNKIKVTNFVDSAIDTAIKEADIILLGSDALLESGAINKVGSSAIAGIAKIHKKPLYVISDSWKYFSGEIKIEERNFNEVWKNAPINIRVRNPAFEKINKSLINAVISEKGKLKYEKFIKKMRVSKLL